MKELGKSRAVGLQRLLRRWGEIVFGRGASPLLLIAAVLGAAAGLLSAAFWDTLGALAAAIDFYVVRPLDQS